MKSITKLLCVLLAMSFLLGGCGSQTPTAPATEPPTEPPLPPVTSEETLKEALKALGRVEVAADLEVASGAVVKGNLLDGGGHTITSTAYDENDPDTECAVFLIEGNVENVTVKGAYRAIGNNQDHRTTGEARISNVIAEGERCALYFGYGDVKGGLYVKNSTLLGMTVFNRVTRAQFDECTFGFNDSGSQGSLAAYVDTTLVGCNFVGKTESNGSVTPFTLTFKKNSAGITMILENCYVGDTLITEDNIDRLLNVKEYDNTVWVRNTIS